ncbi:MAG: lysylphosphatidylglycerol synthase domain-containing protein [Sphingomonadaceae bacterium]
MACGIWRLASRSFPLLVLLFWAGFVGSHWSELSTWEWSLDAGGAALSILLFCLYFLGQAVGWTFVARGMGYRLPLLGGTGLWLLSTPARYVPGNVWHIVTRVHLARRYRLSIEDVLVSSTVEQALTVLAPACLGLGWVFSYSGVSQIWGGLLILLACLLDIQPPLLRFLLQLASRFLRRPKPSFSLTYRSVARLFLLYGFVSAAGGAAFAALVTSSLSGQQLSWPMLASGYCLAYTVGYVSLLAPSGIGVREAALAGMLALYLPLPAALSLSLLSRLFAMVGEALAVCCVGLPQWIRWRQLPNRVEDVGTLTVK